MDAEKRILLKELKFYSDLLKKHEATQKKSNLQFLSNPQASNSTSWKQKSSYKMVKNPAQHLTSETTKYPFNKSHQNTRSKFYSHTNHFKAKSKVIPKVTVNDSVSSNKFIFKSVVLNKNSQTQNIQPVLNRENTFAKESTKILENSGKTESHSHSLMKEIESLTQILKKASENKSKVLTTVAKDDNRMHDKQQLSKNIQCLSHPSNNYSTSKVISASSDSKDFDKKLKVSDSNFKSFTSLNKNSAVDSKDFVFGKEKHASNFSHSNRVKLAKYSYKKSNTEKCTAVNPSDSVEASVKESNCSLRNVKKLCDEKEISQDSKSAIDNLSSDAFKHKSKIFNLDQPLIKPVMTKKLVNPRSKFCSRNYNTVYSHVLKSPYVPNIKTSCTSYRRINGINYVSTIPHKRKNSFKFSNSNKKSKKTVNKFKLVNKTPVLYRNKVKKIVLSSSGCKENSPLQVDKSDPLFKILNDSSIEKLEQDLLAISTKITATPSNIAKDVKGSENLCNKFNPKISIKMSQKKYKARISKYKIVNSVFSNSTVKIKPILTKLKNVRKINSKFSLINNRATPLRQGKSVLVKRLFKSKKAIVNRNVSPINQSAKIIKSKYFTPNKRKLPYGKLVFNQKMSFTPRSKGFSSYKILTKNSKYRKTPISLYHQKVIRRFYGCHPSNFQYKKYVKNNPRKKLPKGHVHSIFIQGVKYSLNPSGKTLRKLPSPDCRKLNRKIMNYKDFRTLDLRQKPVTPASANFANRVLLRSITCALSATSKKRLRKVNTYCMFYNRFGRCNRGVKCTYIHDPSKIAVCTRFLRGTCKIDGCPFSHEISPGKMAICSFYLVGACDKDSCPYRHEKLSPNAKLCKAFVQGYCPDGKECKNAHILVCPNYVQGNCEKGTACAFPHPPQKGKKHVPKEAEADPKISDDMLLENVERYFQLSEDIRSPRENKSDVNVTKVFVPKPRKLEEQPSFIPLSDS